MTSHSNTSSIEHQSQHDWAQGFKKHTCRHGVLTCRYSLWGISSSGRPSFWATIMLSVLLYAGAAQYACLPMLSAGMPIGSMATNIAAINLRHVFYGMPLLQSLPDNKLAKTYCLFALTDETFSVMTSLPQPLRKTLMLPISLFNQSWWVVAGGIGFILGGT
nr:AzlC family ABC transporter permease [Psychrobacter sp. PraFG1]UNK04616.1 AzlC family ABC transporter permease [Psychrobacter sp. PraFG1]